MKKNNFTTLFLLLFLTISYSQKKTPQIEITPFIRWDNYPAYSFNDYGNGNTATIKTNSTSIGFNINYKIPIDKNIWFKIGLGYFENSINKLNHSSYGINSNARPLYFPSPLFITFATDEYLYNIASLNLGVEKVFALKHNLQLVTGLNIANHFTFSQYYHITFNPEGSQDYKTHTTDYFGLSTSLTVGILKHIGKVQLGPSIILPVFDLTKKDEIFIEKDIPEYKIKWLNGIGFSVTCVIPVNP